MCRFYANTLSFYIDDLSITGFWHLHSLRPVPGESQKQLYLQLSGFGMFPEFRDSVYLLGELYV